MKVGFQVFTLNSSFYQIAEFSSLLAIVGIDPK